MDLGVILIYLVVIVVSMVVHEIAHAFASYKLGDDTARLYNRLSFNPLRHIDPFMTILLPLILALSGGPIFGAAKPVLINKRKLRYGDWGVALVALAGPVSNLLLSFIFYGLMTVAVKSTASVFLINSLMLACVVNLGFFLFNILPLVPLDGSRLLYALAPVSIQNFMDKIEPYGTFVVILFLFAFRSIFFNLMNSGINLFLSFYSGIFSAII